MRRVVFILILLFSSFSQARNQYPVRVCGELSFSLEAQKYQLLIPLEESLQNSPALFEEVVLLEDGYLGLTEELKQVLGRGRSARRVCAEGFLLDRQRLSTYLVYSGGPRSGFSVGN